MPEIRVNAVPDDGIDVRFQVNVPDHGVAELVPEGEVRGSIHIHGERHIGDTVTVWQRLEKFGSVDVLADHGAIQCRRMCADDLDMVSIQPVFYGWFIHVCRLLCQAQHHPT